jgi:hypothetical protein
LVSSEYLHDCTGPDDWLEKAKKEAEAVYETELKASKKELKNSKKDHNSRTRFYTLCCE